MGGAQRLERGVGVRQRDLHQRLEPRQRGAQLVRGVGDELALGVEGRVEPREQPVEGVSELLELVVGPVEREPLMQVRRRYVTGGAS